MCVAIAVLYCVAVRATPGVQVQFKTSVQSVLVDVSVLRRNQPVTSLTLDDFKVTDNGAPQQVESIGNTAIPVDVSLVADATWFTQGLAGGAAGPAGTRELHRNAQQMAGLLKADDRLSVMAYASDLVETRSMSPIGSEANDVDLANPTTYLVSNPVPMGQAILTALTAPTPPDRRHLVILFSAARLKTDVPLLESVVPAAMRADALLFTVLHPASRTVDTRQPIPAYPSDEMVREGATKVAEATGGKAYLTGNAVGALRDVLKQFRQRYVLRYSLQGVPARGWHDIVVTVPGCPDCTIQARRGYMAR